MRKVGYCLVIRAWQDARNANVPTGYPTSSVKGVTVDLLAYNHRASVTTVQTTMNTQMIVSRTVDGIQ